MRILHCCLAAFYIDGYNYQENVLPRISKEKGHDVLIIASTETYVGNTSLGYVAPSDYITEYGVPIKRLPYKHIVSHRISRKIRKYIGLYDAIERFAPDIIFSHDISYASVIDVVEYVKNHPNVTFLADTHTAAYNSGLNWMSLNILHRLIYKRYIGKTIPYLKKYYYIGPEEKEFSIKNYGVPEGVMEFLPLGGIIMEYGEFVRKRAEFRSEFNIKDGELLLVHSGKMDVSKKTIDLLRAFKKVDKLQARLIVVGSISKEIEEEVFSLIGNDDRVEYLGWQRPDYLLGCLCAADLYCQPGSPSVTLQNAICCGAAVMSQPFEMYKMLNVGNFYWVEGEESIVDVLTEIADNPKLIDMARKGSVMCARKYLDYHQMEKRILAEH